MKYIFVAGAPGSKWSSVVKNIYYSPSIDRSDYKEAWTYYHDASGKMDLMHLGAYFDPGMACPLPEDLSLLNREQLEETFAYPFDKETSGVRIIKSHVFSNYIDHLKKCFPETPIVLVYRSDDSCLGWWVKCGHFNISYPLYHSYYVDLKHMATIIKNQNLGILDAWKKYPGTEVLSNRSLATTLNISDPPFEYMQEYATNDIKVKVI